MEKNPKPLLVQGILADDTGSWAALAEHSPGTKPQCQQGNIKRRHQRLPCLWAEALIATVGVSNLAIVQTNGIAVCSMDQAQDIKNWSTN